MTERRAHVPLPDRRSAERQWHKLVSPRGRTPLHALALGNKVLGVYTHFDIDVKRTLPCMGDGACPYCKAGINRRWKGYLAALLPTREQCVLEFTEGAARSMETLLKDRTELRGCVVTLFRKGSAANSSVFVKLDLKTTLKDLPPDFDVLPHLERLWGMFSKKAAEMRAKKYVDLGMIEGELIKEFPRD